MATGNSLFIAQFIISYWQSFPTCVQKIKINKGICGQEHLCLTHDMHLSGRST
jgi:hypothetical protein